jgi:hypothetical protein
MTRKQIQTSDFKHYIGDVNLEYGGLFINLDDWKYGYAEGLRVVDLDSACGFDGAVMVERITINKTKKADIICALKCVGQSPKDLGKIKKEYRVECLIYALETYGLGVDIESDPYHGDQRWIIQTDPQGPMQYDGWKADVKLHGGRLIDYLYRKLYFQDFE